MGRKFYLGLDLGTQVGVSRVFMDGDVECLTVKLKTAPELRLRALQDVLRVNDTPDCMGVAVEEPFGRHYNVVRMHMRLLGAVEMACHVRGLPFNPVNASTVKKQATGKGNADKEMKLS